MERRSISYVRYCLFPVPRRCCGPREEDFMTSYGETERGVAGRVPRTNKPTKKGLRPSVLACSLYHAVQRYTKQGMYDRVSTRVRCAVREV